eukprot:scaffold976_cov102-Skeletonema_dohrnii-CCMP3373.AAC.12
MLDECKPRQQSNIHEKGNEYTVQYTKLSKPIQQFKPLNNNNNNNAQDSSSSNAADNFRPCPPAWKLNQIYSENDGVTSSSTFTIYTCQGHYPTTNNHCGQPPYEIERGSMYTDAWNNVGQCVNGQMVLNNPDEAVNLHMYTGTTIAMITSPPSPHPSPRVRTTSSTGGSRNFPTAKKVVEEASMAASFVQAVAPIKSEEQPEELYSASEELTTTASESMNDTVCIDGVLYVCTIQDWCDLSDFELKVGRYWTLVWVEYGSCGGVEDFVGGGGTVGGSSSEMSIVEETTSDSPCPYKAWVAGHYSEGDMIEASREVFKCKDYPYSQWCGMRGYQPRVDMHWEMAWKLEGDCSDVVEPADVVTVPPTPGPTPNPIPRPGTLPIYQPTGPDLIVTPGPTSKPVETVNVGVVSNPRPPEVPVNTGPGPETPKPTARPVVPTPRPVAPTPKPTPKPILPTPRPVDPDPTPKPTPKPPRPVDPTPKPTVRPVALPPPASSSSTTGGVEIVKVPSTTQEVYSILERKKSRIDSELFLYDSGTWGEYLESTVYRYRGFRDGLEVMHEEGVGDSFFYLGDDSDIGYKIGLVNIAAFIAQSMKETIKYDVCDENSWDMVDSKYPLSNSCGQLGQSYQDYHCPENEKHMECPVDPNMKITATTHAKWYGAPAPLFCGPKKEIGPFTGFWDYTIHCDNVWADPPEYCDVYEGQKGGGFDNTSPVKNSAGRTDVEGCCWWGRGVIQTTGVCNFGKLNYFLGARAAKEGRPSRYPSIDFCKTPDAICASEEYQELKWVAGFFYWVNSLQSYKSGGWDYTTELHKFVENGMVGDAFINAVSGIVNRGCHNPPCGTGPVDGGAERSANFRKTVRLVNISSSAAFLDYSAIDITQDGKLAITSQEHSAVWLGQAKGIDNGIIDPIGFDFEVESTVLQFPKDGGCHNIYCNIEGIHFMNDDMFAKYGKVTKLSDV